LRCYFVCGGVASLVSAQGGNPYRIQMNVAADLQRFRWLVQDGFETSLKQWSNPTVFSIELHAVADIQPMERFAEVRLSAFQLEMVVVTHQGVAMQPYPEPFG
jgi:hypothetical protein